MRRGRLRRFATSPPRPRWRAAAAGCSTSTGGTAEGTAAVHLPATASAAAATGVEVVTAPNRTPPRRMGSRRRRRADGSRTYPSCRRPSRPSSPWWRCARMGGACTSRLSRRRAERSATAAQGAGIIRRTKSVGR